ncbi:hypothetical protein [Nocardia sp. NPDC004604]|uniref:hypothetical protein n=1 Tax=Nocardia sp. NPDC004604 TaxID=3157013 RepID=UPI0033A1FC7F
MTARPVERGARPAGALVGVVTLTIAALSGGILGRGPVEQGPGRDSRAPVIPVAPGRARSRPSKHRERGGHRSGLDLPGRCGRLLITLGHRVFRDRYRSEEQSRCADRE